MRLKCPAGSAGKRSDESWGLQEASSVQGTQAIASAVVSGGACSSDTSIQPLQVGSDWVCKMTGQAKSCQQCGGRIVRGVTHEHIAPCEVCGKRKIWCRCIGRKQRGEGVARAFTKEGEEVFLMSIMTICPIARAAAARPICAAFLRTRGCDAVDDEMLPVQCRPVGGGAVSHVCCERFVYTDEAREQAAWFRDTGRLWIANRLHDLTDNVNLMKAMLVGIVSPETGGVLEYLGLEEAI